MIIIIPADINSAKLLIKLIKLGVDVILIVTLSDSLFILEDRESLEELTELETKLDELVGLEGLEGLEVIGPVLTRKMSEVAVAFPPLESVTVTVIVYEPAERGMQEIVSVVEGLQFKFESEGSHSYMRDPEPLEPITLNVRVFPTIPGDEDGIGTVTAGNDSTLYVSFSL